VIAESVAKVDGTTEPNAPTFWAGQPGPSAPVLGRNIEVQHRAFSLYWLEPPLGDASKDFNLYCWQIRIRIAGPRSANMPDDIVLEVVEEHRESDFDPLHTCLEMGSPIVREHHGNSIREPDAILVRDLY
jgi:hypothetical protein